jgi:L-fuculokinase
MMTRSLAATSSPAQLHSGVTTEFDAIPGLYNIGVNWLGSGVVEWFRRMFYGNYSAPACYEAMIAHADTVPPGACGVVVDPDFGNLSQTNTMGKLAGINLQTTPGIIIRAVFEALSYTAKQSLQTLENAGNFKAEKLIVVGGGSKNRLWNQIRADVLGIPVETIQHKETTILGASFFAFASAGQGLTAEQVRESVDYAPETFFPSSNSAIYQELYTQWIAKLKRI